MAAMCHRGRGNIDYRIGPLSRCLPLHGLLFGILVPNFDNP